MGFRFRKSFNLGLGFRITFSKSGVSYSWGSNGYRVTRTSKNTIKTTNYIPGTGISYSTEKRINTRSNTIEHSNIDNRANDEKIITHSNFDLQSDEYTQKLNEHLNAYNKNYKRICFALIASLFLMIFLLTTKRYIYLKCAISFIWAGYLIYAVVKLFKDKCNIYYESLEDCDVLRCYSEFNNCIKKISKCENKDCYESISQCDYKNSAGLTNNPNSIPISFLYKPPFFLRINVKIIGIKAGNNIYYFLPDALMIFDEKHIGIVQYKEIDLECGIGLAINDIIGLPLHAKIVGETYLHVNKSGEADKRFSDNPLLYIYEIGLLNLTSKKVSICISFNDPSISQSIYNCFCVNKCFNNCSLIHYNKNDHYGLY